MTNQERADLEHLLSTDYRLLTKMEKLRLQYLLRLSSAK